MNKFPKLLVPLILVVGLLFPGLPSSSAFASEPDGGSDTVATSTVTPSDKVVATDAVAPSTDGELVAPEELSTEKFTDLADTLVSESSSGSILSRAGPDTPSEADGSKIETVSVKWLTEDADGKEEFLHSVWTDNSPQIIRARVNFALSGQHDYEPGTVSIRLPKNIVKDRFGKYTGEVTIGVPKAPSVSGLFAYTESDNEFILTNTKSLVAAASGMVEISWRNLIPSEIKDYATGYKTDPFSAELTVSTHAGNLIAKSSTVIEGDFDTRTEINSAYKRYEPGVFDSYPDSWPAELKPANPNDYYYAVWSVWASSKANQYYTVRIQDDARASTDAKNALTLGFRSSRDKSVIKGGDGLIVENVYLPDGQNFSGLVYTAYPKADYPENKTYYLKNTVTFTMTGVDDKQQTSTTASATMPFSPLKVEFPTGNFITHKEGDGQTEVIVGSKREGVYATALNVLKKGKPADVSFDVDVFGRGGAWTLKDGGNPELFSDYGAKHYTMIVEDDTTTFNYGPELTTADFEFRSLTVSKPMVETFIPYLEGTVDNPRTGTVFTVNDKPAFNYKVVPDTDLPDLRVYGKVNGGQYTDFGTISFKSGSAVVSPKNGATADGGTLVFPVNVSDYKVEATTTAARVRWTMKPTVRIKPTASILKQIDELYRSAIMPMTRVSNEVEMNVLVDNSTRKLFINRDIGRDQLMGFSHGANLTKELTDYSNDVENQTVDLTYKLAATVQTNMTTREDLTQAIKDGLYTEQLSGTFYDLLPPGVVPDTTSVKLRNGDVVKDVRLYENYKGSGRILMVVKADLKPNYLYDPNLTRKLNILKTPGFFDRPELTFKARYSWYSLADYGVDLANYAAFESGNDSLGDVVGLKGEADNPNGGRNSFSQYVAEQADTLTNLNPDTDNPSFVYAKADSKLVVDTNTLTQLFKQVDVNGEGAWNDGLENLLPKNVFEGGAYTYALRLKSTEVAKTTEMVFYDKLEGYIPTADKKVDYGDTQWHGTFDGVDLKPMIDAGVKPVVYYSTKSGLVLDNTDDRSDNDLTNKTVWSTTPPADKSRITAIAIDARKAADGSNFILPAGESISAFVKMRAPMGKDDWYDTQLADGETEAGSTGGAHAYNNVSLLNKTISVDTGATSDLLLVRYDYVKVGLKPYRINVSKKWDDDNNRDGLRTDAVTVRLFGDGEDTGRSLTLDESNGWSGTFETVPYLNDAGERVNYTIREDTVNGYTFDPGAATSTADGYSYTSVNRHTPKRVNVEGEKKWVGGTTLPASIKVGLYKNDSLYRTVDVKPDRDGKWLFSFDNLYAFEGGKEIKWSVREVDYVKGFIQTVEDFTITNTFDPYGSVKLAKVAENQTEQAKALNPDFTFVFTVFNEDGTLNTNEFKWASTSGRSGTVVSGGTLTLKAGEAATVERVPSDVRYTVKEVDLPAGYKLAKTDGLTDGVVQAGETNTVTFTNRYTSQGKVGINGLKSLTGRAARVGEFSFTLTDEQGTVVSRTYNGLGGLLMFGSLNYTEADAGKTFTYRITEEDRGRGGLTYDGHTEEFTVKVSDNGDGTLTVEPTFDPDGINFANEYHASGEVKLKAWKTVKGGFKLQDGQYSFEVLNGEGQVVATGRNDADGVIEFTPINFDETSVGQTLTFIAREVAGTDSTMNYDKSTVTYTVKPYDNGDGTLSFDAHATDNKVDDVNNDPTTPLFVNEFKPGSLTVSKSITSGDPNKEFRFRAVLKGPDGSVPDGSFNLKRSTVLKGAAGYAIESVVWDSENFYYRHTYTDEGQYNLSPSLYKYNIGTPVKAIASNDVYMLNSSGEVYVLNKNIDAENTGLIVDNIYGRLYDQENIAVKDGKAYFIEERPYSLVEVPGITGTVNLVKYAYPYILIQTDTGVYSIQRGKNNAVKASVFANTFYPNSEDLGVLDENPDGTVTVVQKVDGRWMSYDDSIDIYLFESGSAQLNLSFNGNDFLCLNDLNLTDRGCIPYSPDVKQWDNVFRIDGKYYFMGSSIQELSSLNETVINASATIGESGAVIQTTSGYYVVNDGSQPAQISGVAGDLLSVSDNRLSGIIITTTSGVYAVYRNLDNGINTASSVDDEIKANDQGASGVAGTSTSNTARFAPASFATGVESATLPTAAVEPSLAPAAELNSSNSVAIILSPGDGTGNPVVLRQPVGGSVELPNKIPGWSYVVSGVSYTIGGWTSPDLFDTCLGTCSVPGSAGDVVRLYPNWWQPPYYTGTYEKGDPEAVGSTLNLTAPTGLLNPLPSTPKSWSLTKDGYKYAVSGWNAEHEFLGAIGWDPLKYKSGLWTADKFYLASNEAAPLTETKTTGSVLGSIGGGTASSTCGFGVWTTDGYYLVKEDGATTRVNLPGQVKGAISYCPIVTWSYVWTTDGYFKVNPNGAFVKIPVTGTVQGVIGTEYGTGVWTTDGYFTVSSLGQVTKSQVTGTVKGAIGSSPSSLSGGSAVWTTDGYFLVDPNGTVMKAPIPGKIVGASGDRPLITGSLVWTENKAYIVNNTGSVSPAPYTGVVIDAVGSDFTEVNDAAIAYSLVWTTDGLYYRGLVNKKIDVPGEIRGIYGFKVDDSYARAYVWTTEGLYAINAEGKLSSKSPIAGDVLSVNGSDKTSFGVLISDGYFPRYNMKVNPPTSTYSVGEEVKFTRDETFTAVWEPVNYKVSFNLSGASGSIQPAFYDKGATVKLPTPPVRPYGKRFAGWSTTQGGEPISNPVDLASPGNETTLYAVWADVDNMVNIQDGEFTFTLLPGEKVTLPDLPAGLTYEVYEETEAGWVLVKESNTSGTILANTDSLASFTNEYAPGKTQVKLGGTKTVDGVSTDAGGFTFNLFEGDTLIGSATSGFDGSFTFPTLTYDSAGVHQYTVREVVGERTDVNYDGHTEAVSVTVSDSGDGTLTASTSTDADGVVFNNTMKRGSLTVVKRVEGTADRSKLFHFEVDLNGTVESFSLKGDESKSFTDLPFGTRFEVNEVDLPVGYNLTSLSNKSGVIGPDTPTVTATALNTYSAKGSVQLGGQKVLNGRDQLPPTDGEFSFQLVGSNGEVIQTVSNADGGAFVFDALPVTVAGDSTFIIREVVGSVEGMTYDTHEEKVIVSAVDDGEGNLSTSVKVDADGVVFTNEYRPPTLPNAGEGGPSTVSITKELVGTDSDREFELTVNIVDITGTDYRYSLPWTSSVDPTKSGTIQNGGTLLIRGGETLTVTGVPAGLTFTVKESTPAGYTVHPDSVLTAQTVGSEVAALRVINVYEASSEILLKGSKELFGGNVGDYGFNFILMRDDELLQRVSNDENGAILFKPLYFTTEDIGKTYHYLVAEEAGNEANIGYDQTVYEFDVKVEDNGDGTLKLTSTLDKELNFTNVLSVQGRFPASGSVMVGVFAALGGGAALALWFLRRRRKVQPRH